MKLSNLIILLLAAIFTITSAYGQANANINVLTLNSGQVNIGATIDIQVSIGNSGPASSIGVNKVRAQISVPLVICAALPSDQQPGLPAGWIITSNTGGVITVCNGTDIIAVGEQRQILIKVQGNALGGPSTVSGVLGFGNGVSCTAFGTLSGDITADNTSTSTIQVISIPTPVTLTDFNGTFVNCQPVLHWITETEINSDRFEIERGNMNSSDWISVGVVAANGNTSTRSEYNFTDRNLNVSSKQVLYRLKMIDKDGKYKYSGVLRVFTNCKTAQVYVYPNPVQDGRLYVSLAGTSGYTEAILMSLSGQLILKNTMHNGTNYLNTSIIADGIYILNIKDANGIDKNFKVRIQN